MSEEQNEQPVAVLVGMVESMLKRSEQYRREAEEDKDYNEGEKHARVSSVLKEIVRLGRGLGAAAAGVAEGGSQIEARSTPAPGCISDIQIQSGASNADRGAGGVERAEIADALRSSEIQVRARCLDPKSNEASLVRMAFVQGALWRAGKETEKLPAICACHEPVYMPSLSGYECGTCGCLIDAAEHNRRILARTLNAIDVELYDGLLAYNPDRVLTIRALKENLERLEKKFQQARQWNQLCELELKNLRSLHETPDFEAWFKEFRVADATPLTLWVTEKMKAAWDASAELVRRAAGAGECLDAPDVEPRKYNEKVQRPSPEKGGPDAS